MSMDLILAISRRNLQYAKMHIDDIDDARMCDQPAGLVNHPAWIVGHITGGLTLVGGMLGLPVDVPAGWQALFGWGSAATNDRSRYPSKARLIEAMESWHAKVSEAVLKASPETLARPNPIEPMRAIVPTVGDAVAFILASHTAIHLGQLSAWRQAMGMDLKM